jgi:hypothetical protein
MKKTLPPKLRKFAAAKQHRLDQLLDRNSEGAITPAETAMLKQLVAEAEELMVENGKRLAGFAEKEAAAHPPIGAVPVSVTVWVQPHASHAEP